MSIGRLTNVLALLMTKPKLFYFLSETDLELQFCQNEVIYDFEMLYTILSKTDRKKFVLPGVGECGHSLHVSLHGLFSVKHVYTQMAQCRLEEIVLSTVLQQRIVNT